jgi:hypothetical protein
MDIVHLAFMFGPLLGAVAGYLVDGVTGATLGFVISIGPLVVAWLFGGLDDALRQARPPKPSDSAPRACSSPTRGGFAMKPRRRGLARVTDASR